MSPEVRTFALFYTLISLGFVTIRDDRVLAVGLHSTASNASIGGGNGIG